MPRVKRASTSRCKTHGSECHIGGGSRYRSGMCEPVVQPKGSLASVEVSDEPDAELLRYLAEQRAEREGIPLADVIAAQARELADGQRRWNRLRPERRCAERDKEPGELAEMLAAARVRVH